MDDVATCLRTASAARLAGNPARSAATSPLKKPRFAIMIINRLYAPLLQRKELIFYYVEIVAKRRLIVGREKEIRLYGGAISQLLAELYANFIGNPFDPVSELLMRCVKNLQKALDMSHEMA